MCLFRGPSLRKSPRVSPYVYQLAVGSAVFAAGIWFAWKGGEVGLRRRGGRALWGLLAGLALIALLQGILEAAAGR